MPKDMTVCITLNERHEITITQMLCPYPHSARNWQHQKSSYVSVQLLGQNKHSIFHGSIRRCQMQKQEMNKQFFVLGHWLRLEIGRWIQNPSQLWTVVKLAPDFPVLFG